MTRARGGKDTKHIECVNPKQNKYIVRWDFISVDDNIVEFQYKEFNYKPQLSEIKELITNYYNVKINKKIVEGFIYKNVNVWLSNENQFNYKIAYDVTIQKNGSNLPITFKFGSTENPYYMDFTTIQDLEDFYFKMFDYIQSVLREGWDIKNNINWNCYE